MCGIVGVFSKADSVSEHKLQQAVASLHHRGPDAQRTWISSDRRVGLGHARLSIIDLKTGDQPISNQDGSLTLVANGEFYDFERIREDLKKEGCQFKTESDSEIALHLYERYGASCLRHLRGEFAFVIWDSKNQTLFAARDRFGIKPLYYAFHDDKLFLASEAKALFAAGVPARWDHEAFWQFSHLLTTFQDRSFFEGVKAVPPGHYLIATRNHSQLVPYWDFDYPRQSEIRGESEEEWVGKFHDVFREAIRLRLRADVPVGCYLSGGIDSCAVLGMAQSISAKPIAAFTLSFEDEAYDEGPLAREMAQKTGADFHEIKIRSSQLAENLPQSIRHTESLCINTHGVAKFLLSRYVREQGYKVVLTGEGSDEIFGGYPHFRRDMLLHNSQGQDPEEVRRLLAELQSNNQVSSGLLMPHGDSASLAKIQRILGFVPSFLEAFSTAFQKMRPLISETWIREFGPRDDYPLFVGSHPLNSQIEGRDPVHQSLYLWSRSILPSYILNVLGDRSEMAHSIEGRVPFLDHRVVELLTRVPVSLKIRGMTEKYLLREALRPYLTDTVYRRQKHPFLAPPATLKGNEMLHQLLQDTLRGPGLRRLPFYEPRKVLEILDKLDVMDTGTKVAMDPALMGALSACLLQESFGL